MNKNLRKAMISAICMLIVGVMSLTGVTYAWFTSSSSATVTGMTFDVYSPVGGVLISDTYNTNWGYSIELAKSEAAFENFMPVSTSDNLVGGKLQFFAGTVNTTPSQGELGDEIYTLEAGSTAYFAKNLYLYNDGSEAVSVNLAGTVIGFNTTGEKNNGAEQAMRLALVKHGVYDQKTASVAPAGATDGVAIYEPHSDTHVDGTLTGKLPYYGITGASGVNEWFDSTKASAYTEEVKTVELDDESMTITVPAGQCYAVTVYIWLEGQDVDCVNSVGGSNLMAALSFTKTGAQTE